MRLVLSFDRIQPRSTATAGNVKLLLLLPPGKTVGTPKILARNFVIEFYGWDTLKSSRFCKFCRKVTFEIGLAVAGSPVKYLSLRGFRLSGR